VSVYVKYSVPLMVEVEPATREVLSVHVLDESIDGPFDVVDDDDESVSISEQRQARRVAESAMWPSWTFGW
jgi:hypothetical protein